MLRRYGWGVPSERGWRRRYAYASHGLRFELKAPLEPMPLT
jgi:hypothetical protein